MPAFAQSLRREWLTRWSGRKYSLHGHGNHGRLPVSHFAAGTGTHPAEPSTSRPKANRS